MMTGYHYDRADMFIVTSGTDYKDPWTRVARAFDRMSEVIRSMVQATQIVSEADRFGWYNFLRPDVPRARPVLRLLTAPRIFRRQDRQCHGNRLRSKRRRFVQGLRA